MADAKIKNVPLPQANELVETESGSVRIQDSADDTKFADLGVSPNSNLIVSQVDNLIVQGTDTHTFVAVQNTSNQVDSAVTSPTSGLTMGVNGTTGYILNRYAGELIIGTTNTEAIRIATDEDATFVANLSTNGNATLGDASSDTHTVNGSLGISDTTNTATLSTTAGAHLLTEGTASSFYNIVRGPTGAYSIYQNNTTGDADGSGKGLEVGCTNNSAYVWSYGSGSNGTLSLGAGGSGGLTFSTANDITVLSGYFALQSEDVAPSAPADGDGGILYVKSDGKLYFISHETAETDLTAGGGGDLTITTTSSATYSATTYNTMYIIDSSSNAVEIDLPTASGNAGKTIDVLAKTGATNAVTIDPNGSETINGSSASYVLNTNYSNITLVSDGSNWVIR